MQTEGQNPPSDRNRNNSIRCFQRLELCLSFRLAWRPSGLSWAAVFEQVPHRGGRAKIPRLPNVAVLLDFMYFSCSQLWRKFCRDSNDSCGRRIKSFWLCVCRVYHVTCEQTFFFHQGEKRESVWGSGGSFYSKSCMGYRTVFCKAGDCIYLLPSQLSSGANGTVSILQWVTSWPYQKWHIFGQIYLSGEVFW